MLTLNEFPIGNFTTEYYLLALEKYLYHIIYVHILSKHIYGGTRKEDSLSVSRNILFVRDYTGRLSAHFNLEI